MNPPVTVLIAFDFSGEILCVAQNKKALQQELKVRFDSCHFDAQRIYSPPGHYIGFFEIHQIFEEKST